MSSRNETWREGGGRGGGEGGGGALQTRPETLGLKPVLNWANVCSPNILRTVRRTMIRFLIELLVRRTWFGQLEEFTSFSTGL